MPRRAKDLTDLEVRRLAEPGAHPVGGVPGLYLQVLPGGGKTWLLRATVGQTADGKQRRREIGLGGYPAVTLKQARDKARALREKIAQGIDPVEERRAARAALLARQAAEITFEQAARQCIEAKSPEWKNAKHAQQWLNTLTTYAFPALGKLYLRDIDTPHILAVLEPIWNEKTETASRLRGRIETVLDWATARKYREGLNPARWAGHLATMLPKPAKVARNGNHPALPYERIPAFMKHLRKLGGSGARALEFAILTAARSGEVRGAVWEEIDFEARVWTIPAERMKMRKEHKVPLTEEALSLLAGLPRLENNGFVFPSSRGAGALSDMTLTAVIRRMGGDYVDPKQNNRTVTVHGFRSTFRDWAGETAHHPREVIEHALAHQLRDKAEAAYARGSLLQKRRALMVDWARYCGG